MRSYPRDRCLHEEFALVAKAFPSNVAVACEGRRLTYGELDAAANRVAWKLLRAGVTPDSLVGVCIERSPEMILGLLAILKAGAAYLPMDRGNPEARNRFIIEDAKPRVILTRSGLLNALPACGLPVVCVDDPALGAESSVAPASDTQATNLCYALFTSGSTGHPKAVAVEHRAVMRLVKNADFARMDADETWLVLSPLSFDLSTLEIWAPLCNGGCAAVVPDGPLSLEAVGQTIQGQGVTSAWLTSGLFRSIVEDRIEDLAPLRQLIVGGDIVPVAQARKVVGRFPNLHFVNGYGPTENTTFSCCHTISAADCHRASIPIGKPISNSTCHILDAASQPCAVGVEGEIHVGGDGLARGYLTSRELTGEKFVTHPRLGRLYATGDLGRWLEEGTVEFLGRRDDQLKLRGFRVEPGEVESALMRHPAIRQAVVVPVTFPSGDRKLAACVIPPGIPAEELRTFLTNSLPSHLVPSIFVGLEKLPVTPNGKVDRRLLAHMAAEKKVTGSSAPEDAIERAVWEIWCDVLGTTDIALDESFFDLGGDSLQLARIHSRLACLSREPLPIAELFAFPTARAQAARIAGRLPSPSDVNSTIAARAARQRESARTRRPQSKA